jgi:hypothetical protein
MNNLLFDFDADTRDRLWAALELKNISFRDLLKQSVDTAGAELELRKPGVVGNGRNGKLYAGPAVMSPLGTILIVLADKQKVFTMDLRPVAGRAIGDGITEAVQYLRDNAPEDFKFPLDAIAPVMDFALEEIGRLPGEEGAQLTEEHAFRILGCLFAGMPDAVRSDLINGVEQLSASGVCPAMVGLLGESSKIGAAGLSGVWPLVLRLAPYAETVIGNEPVH